VTIHEVTARVDRRTTQADHLGKVCNFFNSFLLKNTKLSASVAPPANDPGSNLAKLGVGAGPASNDSSPDGLIHFLKDGVPVVVGVWEVKHDTDSVKEMVGQAQAESANVALSLDNPENLGKLTRLSGAISNVAHIPSPFICSNGRYMMFGATIVLSRSCPCTFFISKTLDLTETEDVELAALYLLKMQAYTKMLEAADVALEDPFAQQQDKVQLSLDAWSLPVGTQSESVEPDADKMYILKPLKRMFFTLEDRMQSLALMMLSFRRLYHHPGARKFVVFPYCIRTEGPVSKPVQADVARHLRSSESTSAGAAAAASAAAASDPLSPAAPIVPFSLEAAVKAVLSTTVAAAAKAETAKAAVDDAAKAVESLRAAVAKEGALSADCKNLCNLAAAAANFAKGVAETLANSTEAAKAAAKAAADAVLAELPRGEALVNRLGTMDVVAKAAADAVLAELPRGEALVNRLGTMDVVAADCLVFDNLARSGHRIGLPLSITKTERWLQAVEVALEAVFNAGVVPIRPTSCGERGVTATSW